MAWIEKDYTMRAADRHPDWLTESIAGLDGDAEARRLLGAAVAIEQVDDLRRHDVSEFCFYTLNRAELTCAVCYVLRVRAPAPAAG